MPRFRFDKLVRDKLPEKYSELNQHIVSRRLVGQQLLSALRLKWIEEIQEVPLETGTREEIVDELGDAKQAYEDIKTSLGITEEEIETARLEKLEKKGGFSEGIFVETIELDEGDEWVGYYRTEPEKYKEER